MITNHEQICQLGKKVIETEIATISKLTERLDKNFSKACLELISCKGHIIVIGMGKSGHIANKIAATLASTGTPAFFVHPGEASHGDLGMITKNDAIIAISNSGNTPEILSILPLIEKLAVPLISITGNPKSALAKKAVANLDISIEKEACPLGLAPTSSTTATLVMGDALAITLLEMRGFTAKDFALSHPGGNLGKRLLLKVGDLMRIGDAIPSVTENATLNKALIEMTAKTMGMTTVIDNTSKLLGIFTDGDLRRTLDKNLEFSKTKVIDVMTLNCKTLTPDVLAFDALKLMENFKITSLVVVDDKSHIAGVIHIHDILRTGLV